MRLINRSQVMIAYLGNLGLKDSYKAKYEALAKAIDEAPIIDAELVKHGLWIRPTFDPAWVKCSECGCYWEGGIVENCSMHYCPNCGAKMDAEAEG